MKKLLSVLAFSIALTLTAHAQLAKTKWTGSMNLPQGDGTMAPTDVEWDFSKDTLTIQIVGGQPEIFTFRDVKKVLTLVKVSGGSECPAGAKMTSSYVVSGGKLSVTHQTSDCDFYNKINPAKDLKKMK